MAGWRQAVEVAMTDEEVARLMAISRSRTEPASRVERAQMLLAYREKPSFFAVGQRLGVHHQTVQRCIERALAYGPLMALDDRPRPGKEPTITPEAKAWLVSLACRKAKELGYPHELWTTRLLARHAREHGAAAGHECLARLVQGMVCKILGQEEIKPHKVRYYLERRDAELHVVTVDPHTAQIEGFFYAPVDSLTAVPTLYRALRGRLPTKHNLSKGFVRRKDSFRRESFGCSGSRASRLYPCHSARWKSN